MTEILYNFASNQSSLDDINGGIQAINAVKADIDSMFKALGSVYEGDGAGALNQAHIEVGNMLDEALNVFANTQKQAQDQQDAMKAMDNANANSF